MRAAALMACALLAPAVAAQSADPSGAPAPTHELRADEVAWIDGADVITLAELDRYLATVYARKPEGQAALLQVLQEQMVTDEAARAGLAVADEDVTAFLSALDAQARDAGGLAALLNTNVEVSVLRETVRLHLLQERLVRAAGHMLPFEPVPAEQLVKWMDAHVATADLKEAPLDDARAATWAGGEIAKQPVGARLRAVLKPDDLAGVLTEMIGVQLVRRRAAELDIDLTPAEVTREVLQRDALLKAHADGMQVNYKQFVEQVEHRSLNEFIQSDAFTTEVLMRLISEHDWTEAQARAFWEKNEEGYRKRGMVGTWEQVRASVWKDIRGAVYKDLFTKSRIVRRY